MSVTGNKLRRVNILEEEERTVMSLSKEELFGGREWVRKHKGTPVTDTPLWVLISLGVMAMMEEENE